MIQASDAVMAHAEVKHPDDFGCVEHDAGAPLRNALMIAHEAFVTQNGWRLQGSPALSCINVTHPSLTDAAPMESGDPCWARSVHLLGAAMKRSNSSYDHDCIDFFAAISEAQQQHASNLGGAATARRCAERFEQAFRA